MRQILRMGEMTFVKTFFVFKAPFFRMNGGQKETVFSPLFSQTVFLPSLSKRPLFEQRPAFFSKGKISGGANLFFTVFQPLSLIFNPQLRIF